MDKGKLGGDIYKIDAVASAREIETKHVYFAPIYILWIMGRVGGWTRCWPWLTA